MDSNKPIDLEDKVDYLKEKINQVYRSVKSTENYNTKLQFIQYLDFATESLQKIQANSTSQHSSGSRQNSPEKAKGTQQQKLQLERLIMQHRLFQLKQKQRQLELDKLKIKIENGELENRSLQKQLQERGAQQIKEIESLKESNKYHERQLERLGKINVFQVTEIDRLKLERKNAEEIYTTLLEEYQKEMKNIEEFGDKSNKYKLKIS